MTANNLRQAEVPEGAWPIPEMPGTAPGLVCPSAPNTIPPRTARRRASSAASTMSAAASSPAFAVMRTLMPSIPLARNARVGLPSASSSAIRGASISASPDSLWPQVRSTRLPMIALTPARRCRSGSTVPSIIVRISCGTPGTA